MPATRLAAAALVVLLAAGGVAATTGGVPLAAQTAGPDATNASTVPSDVDADATYANGTVTVAVTDDGAPLENVTVARDEATARTGANGTVAFDATLTEELELELHGPNFEGELEYRVQNDSLRLVEEEYEYEVPDEDSEDDAESDEAENEEAEDETDSEEAEDEEADDEAENEEAEDETDSEEAEDEEADEEAEDEESEDGAEDDTDGEAPPSEP